MTQYYRTDVVEAMRWGDVDGCGFYATEKHAQNVVAWIVANGGEARYESGASEFNVIAASEGREAVARRAPRIAVRASIGVVRVEPGDYVVMSDVRFCPHAEYGEPGHECDGLRSFYRHSPDAFERNWPDSVEDSKVRQVELELWRSEAKRGRVPLGAFNWPWALGVALDEIERLRGTPNPTPTEDPL